jgi:hypothetical protein
MMVPTVLSVDSDLTVTTTIPLDLRQVYHVRLALQYDLLAINPAAQVRMQQHCAATNKIITALDGKIKLRPGLPICSPTDTMTRWDYQQMSKLINARCGRNYGRIGTTMMETVGTLFVNTQRRGNFTDLAELERLEQRRRMMECLAARAAYPQPELYKHEQQEAWFDAHGESTGECSTGEEESSGEHISS